MDERSLLCAVEDRVVVIRLNRPKTLNALTPDLLDGLRRAIEGYAADDAVGAILLTGEGRGFSSGADLIANAAQPPRDAEGRLDLGHALEACYNPLVLQMRTCPKPIIAAVNGMAAGAGASLALMADLTLAARSAYFLQAFVHIGLIPDAGATWILPRLVGAQRAMGLALLGERLSAQDAKDWGLIWDVVDDEQLLPTALALARRLASGPGLAIARIKRALQAALGNDLTVQLQLEAELQRECGRTQDFIEGAAAFVQKRPPRFRNR